MLLCIGLPPCVQLRLYKCMRGEGSVRGGGGGGGGGGRGRISVCVYVCVRHTDTHTHSQREIGGMWRCDPLRLSLFPLPADVVP